MKLPKIVTITVLDSTEADKKHSLSRHFEILARKMLNIFARNPSEFSALHSSLKREVAEYGSVKEGLEKERLITPELLLVMISNEHVCSNHF